MKKILLLIFLASIPLLAESQQLVPVTVSENLSLLLPDNYDRRDTLGVNTFSGIMDFGVVAVIVINDTRGKITDNAEIEKFFKGYTKGMVEQVNGKITSQTFLQKQLFKISNVTMITELENMIQWNSYSFRLNSTTYSVQFIYPEKVNKIDMENKIIESLKLSEN